MQNKSCCVQPSLEQLSPRDLGGSGDAHFVLRYPPYICMLLAPARLPAEERGKSLCAGLGRARCCGAGTVELAGQHGWVPAMEGGCTGEREWF